MFMEETGSQQLGAVLPNGQQHQSPFSELMEIDDTQEDGADNAMTISPSSLSPQQASYLPNEVLHALLSCMRRAELDHLYAGTVRLQAKIAGQFAVTPHRVINEVWIPLSDREYQRYQLKWIRTRHVHIMLNRGIFAGYRHDTDALKHLWTTNPNATITFGCEYFERAKFESLLSEYLTSETRARQIVCQLACWHGADTSSRISSPSVDIRAFIADGVARDLRLDCEIIVDAASVPDFLHRKAATRRSIVASGDDSGIGAEKTSHAVPHPVRLELPFISLYSPSERSLKAVWLLQALCERFFHALAPQSYELRITHLEKYHFHAHLDTFKHMNHLGECLEARFAPTRSVVDRAPKWYTIHRYPTTVEHAPRG